MDTLTNPTEIPAISAPQKEQKPKIINVISLLLLIIAILYMFSTISLTGIIIIMHRSSTMFSISDLWLKNFPLFGILPILFSSAMFLFFYSSCKVKDGSRFSFWLCLLSLLFIPLPFAYISEQILTNTSNVFREFGLENSPPLPTEPTMFKFWDPLFILEFISVVLLLVSYKKFRYENIPLSKKYRILLAVIFSLVVIPINAAVGYSYMQALDTDYGYTSLSKKVDYHVYRPTHLPEKIDYATKFEFTDALLAGKENTISVAFDAPVIKNRQMIPILVSMRQAKVESDFDLLAFVNEDAKIKEDIPQQIVVKNALDEEAYWYKRTLSKGEVNFLVFKTEDHVLIYLSSPNVSVETLIEIADALQ